MDEAWKAWLGIILSLIKNNVPTIILKKNLNTLWFDKEVLLLRKKKCIACLIA